MCSLINAEFLTRFEQTRVRHVSAIESDHCFVITEIKDRFMVADSRGPKSFKYENMCICDMKGFVRVTCPLSCLHFAEMWIYFHFGEF